MSAPLQKQIRKGATDQSVIVRLWQISVATGGDTPALSVAETASGLELLYVRDGGDRVFMSAAAVSFLTSAHTDGGFEPIRDGYYRVDLPDAAVAKGANGVLVFGSCTGMRIDGCYVMLVDGDRSPVATTPQVY